MLTKNLKMLASSAMAVLALQACKFKSAEATESVGDEVYSCRVDRAGLLSLCTEFRKLPGEALEAAQRTCESYTANGYEWKHAACEGDDKVGGCILGEKESDSRVPSVQFHYSPFFTDEVAEGMCQRMGGIPVAASKG